MTQLVTIFKNNGTTGGLIGTKGGLIRVKFDKSIQTSHAANDNKVKIERNVQFNCDGPSFSETGSK